MDESIYSDIDQILERLDEIEDPDTTGLSEKVKNFPGVNGTNSSLLSAVDEVDLPSLNRSLLTLQSASSALSSSVGHNQVLETFTLEMISLLQADGCLAFEYDASREDFALITDRSLLEGLTGLDPYQPLHLGENELVRRVLEERCAVQINSSSNRNEIGPIELLQKFSAGSMIILPMVFQVRTLGLVIIIDTRSAHNFTNQEISLAQLLTDQATGALVNAELHRSLAMADDQLAVMNDELDAYAHSVAHNLKNPLAHILGFSQILSEGVEELSTDEVSQYLDYIGDGALKIRDIIDGLSLLANIRREEVDFEPIDMAMVVDEALTTLSTQIDEYKPEISLPTSWPMSWGNENWVEQVWINYLSNGLKYGGRPPSLKLGSNLQRDGMVQFWVGDNGAGLTQEQQAKLFRPFSRLKGSQIEGHGLGLSIVQNMVMKLGGRVWMESEPGKGSLFYFSLPSNHPEVVIG